MRRPKLKIMAAAVVVPTVAAAVAYGAWTANGTGQGTVTAGTSAAVTLTPAVPSDSLYPTASARVATTVANPNPYAVHVSSITLDTTQGTGGFAVDGAHSTCNLASLSFTAQTNGGNGWDIAANDDVELQLDDAVAMSNAALDACQGATFTVHLSAAAVSAS
jgi:hypothetical protein